MELTEHHTCAKSSCSLHKRLQRNRKAAFNRSVTEVPVAFCLLLTNNARFLVSQLCATRKLICLLLTARLSPHFLKSTFGLDEGGQGSPQQSEGMSSIDNREPSTWACFQHLFFFYQNGYTQMCGLAAAENKIPIHLWMGQKSTGEWTLPMLFFKVSEIHHDATTAKRVLKPFTFKIAYRTSLLSTLYVQELQQTCLVTTVEAVLCHGYLSPGNRTEATNQICMDYHAVFRW